MRSFLIVRLLLIVWAVVVEFRLEANTGGDAIIDPEQQGQLIDVFFKDFKSSDNPNLSLSEATNLFVTDGFNGVRTPIFGDDSHPAHPTNGVVIASYYTNHISAILTAKSVRPDLMVFASKKLDGQTSFPGWTKTNGAVYGPQYAIMLADYLQFMGSNGITIDVLGLDNERQYNEGDINPSKFRTTVDNLRTLSTNRGFPMPLIIGHEDYGPNKDSWMTNLVNNGWSGRLDIFGTHYYPELRPKTGLLADLALAGNKPKWHTELHWQNQNPQDELAVAEVSIVTMWDCTDSGMNGLMWWAYERTGLRGQMMKHFSTPLLGSRPVVMDDFDGTNTLTLGRLQTRAFRNGNQLSVFALNLDSTNGYTNYGFRQLAGGISGNVAFRQWTDTSATAGDTGNAPISGSNIFRLTIPPRSITKFTATYAPPGSNAVLHLDGDVTDSSGNNNHGAVIGSPTVVPGLAGSALRFNGTNNYAEVHRMIGDDFSIAFWINTTNPGPAGTGWWSGDGLVDGEVAGNAHDFGVSLSGTQVAFGIGNTNGGVPANVTIKSTSLVTDGQWHHVVATRESATGAMKLFIDGALETSGNGSTGSKNAPDMLRIGALQTLVAGNFFAGALDEIRLYSRVLSATEIAALAGTRNALVTIGSTSATARLLSWETIPGWRYQVQFNTNLATGTWQALGTQVNATSLLMMLTNSVSTATQRYYRILEVP